MFYVNLLNYRFRRLKNKYHDMKHSSGSTLKSLVFLFLFVSTRFQYLWRHIRLRGEIPKVRADIAAGGADGRPMIAFKIVGGIGDHIIAARLITDLRGSVEPFAFHVHSSDPASAGWIFRAIPGFRGAWSEFLFPTLRREYDAAIWVSHFVVVHAEDAKWDRLRQNPRLNRALEAAVAFRARIEDFVIRHPAKDNALARHAVAMNYNRMTLGHGMFQILDRAGFPRLEIDERILAAHDLEPLGYITIHNGFDTNMVVLDKTSTKCYPRFADVVRDIKAARPDLRIVQLGASTSAAIDGVDLSLVGRTTLPELGALLKHAAWHIDIESGLVHMARCFDTPSTVVFGPTPIDYFGYEGNRNIPPPVCGDCWWTRETWMARCPRGLAIPVCTTHDPAQIARQTLEGLSARQPIQPLRRLIA